MRTRILKVVTQDTVSYVPSNKTEGGQLAKSVIRLSELGGKYENSYVCSMFGNLALCRFYSGDVVAASLRFQAREVNGQYYQDVVVSEIVKLNGK